MSTENCREQPVDADFSAVQERLAALLAAGHTLRSAAANVEIGERTAYTYRNQAGFAELVNRLRSAMFAAALGKLASLQTKAAETMEELLGPENPPAVRLAAARGIIADGATIRQSVELDQRLTELEERLA